MTEPPGAAVVLDGKLLEGVTPVTLPDVASPGRTTVVREQLE